MKGYIEVYTGDGKGKTTAAIGLAVRAVGAGKKVCFIQFMKSLAYSEQKILQGLPGLTLITLGKPYFIAKEGMLSEEESQSLGLRIARLPRRASAERISRHGPQGDRGCGQSSLQRL